MNVKTLKTATMLIALVTVLLVGAVPLADSKAADSAQFEPATERTEVIARYEKMRYGMYIHFTIKTFTDESFLETIKGPLPPPKIYNPTNLDVDQWIATAKASGMRYAVLTSKHALGFALWDSEYTDYDVASSGNKTDVVAEFVKACRKYEIAPVLFYSLGSDAAHRRDRKMSGDIWYEHANNQIKELLTNYGPISAFWLDGLSRVPSARLQQAYDTIKSIQPDCLVVANQGYSDGTRLKYWPTDIVTGECTCPPPEGHNPWMKYNGKTYYIPMEVCNTINQGIFSKGWFWEPDEQLREVKRELLPLFQKSTGRQANLTLNVTINRQGRVPQATVKRLSELYKAIKESGR